VRLLNSRFYQDFVKTIYTSGDNEVWGQLMEKVLEDSTDRVVEDFMRTFKKNSTDKIALWACCSGI
jgi:hypothetical protein